MNRTTTINTIIIPPTPANTAPNMESSPSSVDDLPVGVVVGLVVEVWVALVILSVDDSDGRDDIEPVSEGLVSSLILLVVRILYYR